MAREVEQVEDRKRQSDLAACAEVLGGLRFSKELLRGLFREEIVKESVIYQEILQEGIQEGSQEKARTIAVKMLAEGMNVDLIARVTDLTPKQIEDLRNGASS